MHAVCNSLSDLTSPKPNVSSPTCCIYMETEQQVNRFIKLLRKDKNEMVMQKCTSIKAQIMRMTYKENGLKALINKALRKRKQ